ncbi:MAG: GHMP kinase [Beijerinckiaceae bacterium]|nr:GHMP kinase [Beijerinckiaceae bacterium]
MLYVTRTPLRVSLFGGGTDYPEYFDRHPGAVVGFAIDKYIHLGVIRLTAFQDYNYRLSYSKLEHVKTIDEINHPVVRQVLKHYDVKDRLDINIMSDLPSTGSGLGSSSSFTVGFLNVIHALTRRPSTRIDLAKSAIFVERELLRENVGVQDQLHATFGGINRFDLSKGKFSLSPVQILAHTLLRLDASMVLVHTGIARRATAVVEAQIEATKSKRIDKPLSQLYEQVGKAVGILETGGPSAIEELGDMLNETWHIKRSLSDSVTTTEIDDLFKIIQSAGAYGAKLCGAGGGGFFLTLIAPEKLEGLKQAVAPRAVIPIKVDHGGSQLIYPSHNRDSTFDVFRG